MIRLFYSLGSCSLASHIALEEAGAAYEVVRTNVRIGDQLKPEYLAINPKGRVPALVTDQGVLTETVAILSYIAETHPQANLLPVDAWARHQALKGPWVLGERYSVCDGYLFTIADWLELDGVDPTLFPKVHAHRERVRARPAVRKALADEAA